MHLPALTAYSDPVEKGFQGSDRDGVIDSLDHLQAIGVNCLYLMPIFSSAANAAIQLRH